MFGIDDDNRMVLVINKNSVSEEELESYRLLLEERLGKPVIIGQSCEVIVLVF